MQQLEKKKNPDSQITSSAKLKTRKTKIQIFYKNN